MTTILSSSSRSLAAELRGYALLALGLAFGLGFAGQFWRAPEASLRSSESQVAAQPAHAPCQQQPAARS